MWEWHRSFKRFTRKWLPTLDTLRNFFLLPTAEMLAVFHRVCEGIL